MNEKVVALPGCSIPNHFGEPISEIVDLLEMLLEKARAGELVALAYGSVERYSSTDLRATYSWAHGTGAKDSMIKAVAMMNHNIIDRLSGD